MSFKFSWHYGKSICSKMKHANPIHRWRWVKLFIMKIWHQKRNLLCVLYGYIVDTLILATKQTCTQIGSHCKNNIIKVFLFDKTLTLSYTFILQYLDTDTKGWDTHSDFVLAIRDWRLATSDYNQQLVVCDTLSNFFKTSDCGSVRHTLKSLVIRNCQVY